MLNRTVELGLELASRKTEFWHFCPHPQSPIIDRFHNNAFSHHSAIFLVSKNRIFNITVKKIPCTFIAEAFLQFTVAL